MPSFGPLDELMHSIQLISIQFDATSSAHSFHSNSNPIESSRASASACLQAREASSEHRALKDCCCWLVQPDSVDRYKIKGPQSAPGLRRPRAHYSMLTKKDQKTNH